MEKSEAVCAKEALELLNCVTSSSFDQEKCINLLTSLRKCVLDKINRVGARVIEGVRARVHVDQVKKFYDSGKVVKGNRDDRLGQKATPTWPLSLFFCRGRK